MADVPQRATHARQITSVSNRAGRMLKSISTSSASRYSNSDRHHDTDVSENEYGPSPTSATVANHGDRNSPIGSVPGGLESDGGEDAEVDPANIPLPSSAASSMFGRQKSHLLVGTAAAAASSLNQPSSNRPRRSASLSEALGMLQNPIPGGSELTTLLI